VLLFGLSFASVSSGLRRISSKTGYQVRPPYSPRPRLQLVSRFLDLADLAEYADPNRRLLVAAPTTTEKAEPKLAKPVAASATPAEKQPIPIEDDVIEVD
jgi:hypothetical protein